ncbi:hypothetical protein CINS5995_07785, partial [Campylobacter insulaenigrae]|nr:hypothetical protein [Campylobacter insulaenigrae]MCR6580815.1 hypothetical protein [Campylobacter insulaenigrae]MCR6586942.1 hypothetical protein [Campylobacter insulaenigrae]
TIDLDRFDIRTKISNEIYYFANDMEYVDSIFSDSFLKKYFLFDYQILSSHGFKLHSKIRTFDEIKSPPFENEWGWYSTDIPPYCWLQDCQEEEFLNRAKEIYKTFNFSSSYKKIILDTNMICDKLNDFIALHIRGGDIVYSNFRKHAGRQILEERFFPYEIALEIIKNHANSNNKIIIFGQDVKSNMKLLNYIVKNNILPKNKIFTVDEFVNKSFSFLERAFFEINFMSKANTIYSPENSAFSRTAMIISGKNILIAYGKIFNIREQYNIIENNLFSLELNHLQTARSLFYQYNLSLKLKMNLELSLKILRKALSFDRDNDAYRIYMINIFFKKQKYNLIDRYLKFILNARYESFLRTLCDDSLDVFQDYYKEYIHQAKKKFFYINFVAAYINIYNNNIYDALCCLDSMKNINSNNFFLAKIINQIKNHLCYNGEFRLKNSLQYKLGQELLSIFLKGRRGFCRSQYIREKNKINSFIRCYNIKIPPLEVCYDYDNAKRIKGYLSYNLGRIVVSAHKSWYKGAYLLLPYRLYKEYRNFKQGKKKWQ